MTLHRAVLDSILNGKIRNVNVGDIHLANPFDILGTDNIPIKHWGRRANLYFNTESLPDLKWPSQSIEDTVIDSTNASIPGQPPGNCTRQNTQKTYLGAKICNIQEITKS